MAGAVGAGAEDVSAAGTDCASLDTRTRQLLEALAGGGDAVEFSGVVALQRGGDMQIMEISRRVTDGVATQRLARLTGQDAHVLGAEHPLTCVHPGHRLLTAASGTGAGVCELARHYRFRLAPGEPIAGRPAVQLRAEPLDMYRFGHVFDVDRESSLLLRASTLGADQRVLEQYQFASLHFAAQPAARSVAVEHRAAHPHPDEPPQSPGGPAWQVAWLPAGFVATDAAPPRSRRKSFTDGLATFSVFLEPLSQAIRDGEGVERQGSTVAYTRGMQLREQAVLITVLGEIPTNTARIVADSVSLR